MATDISWVRFSTFMCPAIAKTSDAEIVRAASSLVEKNGPEGLVLRDVADLVGIKAPSLYKRFADRKALLRALRQQVQDDLDQALQSAADYSRPAQNKELIVAMAYSYRNFAKRQPELYRLIFWPELLSVGHSNEHEPPLRAIIRDQSGAEQAVPATAFVESVLHGFCTSEINGRFLGEAEADEAFAFSIKAILSALPTPRL